MIHNSLPALPFMRLVKMFADAKGLRFFTWKEQINAIVLYELNASKLN